MDTVIYRTSSKVSAELVAKEENGRVEAVGPEFLVWAERQILEEANGPAVDVPEAETPAPKRRTRRGDS